MVDEKSHDHANCGKEEALELSNHPSPQQQQTQSSTRLGPCVEVGYSRLEGQNIKQEVEEHLALTQQKQCYQGHLLGSSSAAKREEELPRMAQSSNLSGNAQHSSASHLPDDQVLPFLSRFEATEESIEGHAESKSLWDQIEERAESKSLWDQNLFRQTLNSVLQEDTASDLPLDLGEETVASTSNSSCATCIFFKKTCPSDCVFAIYEKESDTVQPQKSTPQSEFCSYSKNYEFSGGEDCHQKEGHTLAKQSFFDQYKPTPKERKNYEEHLLAGRITQSSDSSIEPRHTLAGPSAAGEIALSTKLQHTSSGPSADAQLVPSLSLDTTMKIFDSPHREKSPSTARLNSPSDPSSMTQQASEAYFRAYGEMPTRLTTAPDVRPSLPEFAGFARLFRSGHSAISLGELSFTRSTSPNVSEESAATDRVSHSDFLVPLWFFIDQ